MKIFNFSEYINETKMSGSLVLKERELMKKILRKNIVTFKFQKRDGSIRTAHGTLHPDFLPPLKGTGGPRPSYQLVYYDLDKFGWRSFRSFKFIKIIEKEPVTDEIIDEFKLKKEEEERRREEEKRHHVPKHERERREKERIEKTEEKHKEDKEKKHEDEKPEEMKKKRKREKSFVEREKEMERESDKRDEKTRGKERRMMESLYK